MIARPKLWLTLIVLFIALNFGGSVLAAAQGEFLHAAGHAALLLVGLAVFWGFAPRLIGRSVSGREHSIAGGAPSGMSERLAQMEQAVEAVAIEVERVGEGQRFMTRLFSERDNAEQTEAAPSDVKGPDKRSPQ